MGNNIQVSCAEFSKFLQSADRYPLSDYRNRFFEHIDTIWEQINTSPQRECDADYFFKSCEPLQSSLLHQRTRQKPLGYAGDFLLIDWIYTQKTADSGLGKVFDQMFHTYEAAQAVRNRKDYFIKKCLELGKSRQAQIDVLDIGSGSCRDVLEAHTICNNGTQYYFHCIDHEPQAIDFAKSLLEGTEAEAYVKLECANAFKFRGEQKFDFIWSAGLFDYLEHRLAALLIKKLWRYLKEGGKFIFGNFSPENPTRKGMELVGQWNLIHRSAHELISICEDANISYTTLEVEAEELGINLFCNITK